MRRRANDAAVDNVAKLLKLLGHPDRLRILALLRRGELAVSELVTVLGLSQPRITQYIRSLEDAGLLDRLREGSWVFSRLRDDAPAAPLIGLILDAIPNDDPVYLADQAKLNEVRRVRARLAEQFFANVANDRGQLSHEFLPQEPIEAAMLAAAGEGPFDFMVDLGTGTGRMLELFAGRVAQGAGIDLSPDMLRVARHKLAGDKFGHLFVQQSDLCATPLADNVSDLITLHQVLHHLDDPQFALLEAARLLRPGGTLLVADFVSHGREDFRDDYAHRRLGFEPNEMKILLEHVGLQPIDCTAVPSQRKKIPDVLIWTARQESQS